MKNLLLPLLVFVSSSCASQSLEASAPARVPLEFGHSFTTCLSPEQIWQDLGLAMEDSRRSQLWPQELSSVRGEGLGEGKGIAVTYRSGWFRFTYQYLLRDVSPAQGFRYEAREGHPFEGGARLSWKKGTEGLTEFSWNGVYWVKADDRRGQDFFRDFSRRFFLSLEKNFRAWEAKSCPPSS